MQKKIKKLFKYLTDKQARRLYLYYYHDPPLTYSKIAETEGVSIVSVYHSVRAAEKKIKKMSKKSHLYWKD